MNNTEPTIVEKFERAIVLRSARFLPLILSCVATLMLIAGAVTLVYSLIPSFKPKEPAPVPQPTLVKVSQSDILGYLNRSARASSSTASESGTSESNTTPPQPRVSREAVALAAELETLRQQAARINLSWENEYTTVCGEVYFGYCLQRRTVVTSHGISDYIDEALTRHDTEPSTVEAATVGSRTYHVNPSQADIKIAIIKELESVLAQASPADANKMVGAWAALRGEREDARAATLKKEQDRVAEEYRKAQTQYAVALARKQQARSLSIMGVGLALGGFVLLGLILAVLAIERHTRLLEAQGGAHPTLPPVRLPLPTPVP